MKIVEKKLKGLKNADWTYLGDYGEKYRILSANKKPFRWIVVCTSKDREDTVILP